MTFDWMAFYGGLLAAAVFAGFTMTVGGPPSAPAAVAGPLLVGLVGLAATAFMRRKGAST